MSNPIINIPKYRGGRRDSVKEIEFEREDEFYKVEYIVYPDHIRIKDVLQYDRRSEDYESIDLIQKNYLDQFLEIIEEKEEIEITL